MAPEISLAFDTGGPAFGLTGAPIAELGGDYALIANATLSVTYCGRYGSDAYENALRPA